VTEPARAIETGWIAWQGDRLIRECLKGNEAAWSALIDKYKNLIFSIPIKCGLSSEDASEIFQQVCLALLSELPHLREPQAFPAWLIRITSHECFKWKRQQQRYVQTEINDETTPFGDAPKVGDEILREVEREQILREALSELPPRCRQLIQFLFEQSPAVPYEDVAKSLGVAKGSIGFIRMRCLERLRERLDAKGF
jgi:RNA polymerase sigma factor (sigma-70 family)